jgi:hypothetical protein
VCEVDAMEATFLGSLFRELWFATMSKSTSRGLVPMPAKRATHRGSLGLDIATTDRVPSRGEEIAANSDRVWTNSPPA